MKSLPLKLAALAICLAPAARGQVSGWIDFDRTVPGESTDVAHPSWIVIRSFGIDATPGATGQAGFTIFKKPDKSSPVLFIASAAGTRYPRATVDLNVNQSGVNSRLARLVLENVQVTTSALSGVVTDADPTERLDLNFSKITYTYFIPGGAPVYSSYDYPSSAGTSGTGTSTDIDNDGMPDSWETTYGLSVGSDDSAGDVDGDGLSNLNEFLLGTNPRSGTSFFQAVITPVSPNTWRVTWNSVAGKAYIVEWSPDLTTEFSTLRSVSATAASTSTDVTGPASVGFYRVRPAP